ncbi:hypothetical protein HDU76_011812 [Blyttiomyces sp. JEL0837]|nr:hypothetical protein HDU76_011812 [Blyttiomyces sp. JEL0837]
MPFPDGMIGLECPPGPTGDMIGRFHALIQSLRLTPLWDRALKPLEQDDAYLLSHRTRQLYTAMDSLSNLNPSTIRPTILHKAVNDLTLDLGASPARLRRRRSPSVLNTPGSDSAFSSSSPAYSFPGGVSPSLSLSSMFSNDFPLFPPNVAGSMGGAGAGGAGGSPVPPPKPSSTLMSEETLSLFLAHLLRPNSYEFEERWVTTCPQVQCKTEVQTQYVTCQFLDLMVPTAEVGSSGGIDVNAMGNMLGIPGMDLNSMGMGIPGFDTDQQMGTQQQQGIRPATDRISLQTLVDRRMNGYLSPYRCRNDRCPYRMSAANQQSVQAPTRPQLKDLPALLFVFLKRPDGSSGLVSPTNGGVGGKSMRVSLDSWEFNIARDFFKETPYRVVAALVRNMKPPQAQQSQQPNDSILDNFGDYLMVKPVYDSEIGAQIGGGLDAFGGGFGSPSPGGSINRWILCRNDKIMEVEGLTEDDERGIEVLLCENMNTKR